jgi:hypothetical protein
MSGINEWKGDLPWIGAALEPILGIGVHGK